MTPDAGDPFARLLRAADSPVSPRAEFADALLRRLLGELTEDQPVEPARPAVEPGGVASHQPAGPAPTGAPLPQRRRGWELWPVAVAALLALTVVAGVLMARSRLQPETTTMITAVTIGRFDFLWEIAGGADPLVYTQGMAVDAQGNLWVIDGGNDRIKIFTPDGTLLETWGAHGSAHGQFDFAVPGGVAAARGAGYRGDIAFDAAGSIYVADSGNHRIQKFAPDRSFLLAWGSAGEGDGQFITAKSIAVGPDGSVYVCDEDRRDVQKFDGDGRFLGVLGGDEPDGGKPLTANSVAVDTKGSVWVADQANHRIVRFDRNGRFRDAWGVRGTRPGQLFDPTDLATDAVGLIYVVDRTIHRIQVFSPDGLYLTEAREDPAHPERLDGAHDIATGPAGAVYVSSDPALTAYRVLVLTGDGLMP